MKFLLNDDGLIIQDTETNNSGSINYYIGTVEHNEQWNGLTIEAIITELNSNIAVSRLVVGGEVYLDKVKKGVYNIGFVGYTLEDNEKVYQISTNLQRIAWNKGAGEYELVNDTTISPTEWEIYYEKIRQIVVKTPYVGENGNWYVYDNTSGNYIDSGVKAQGDKGDPGDTGPKGEDAKINGVNTINIIEGDNIDIQQTGTSLIISATGGSGNVDDVKVNGTSVVENKIANIDLSGYVEKVTGKGLSTNDFTNEEKTKLAGLTNYDDTEIRSELDEKINISDIVDDTESTATNKPLSANMGKELQDQINNLQSRGRFLSLWNSTTGLAMSIPTVNPYTYRTGDYFLVEVADSPNLYPIYDSTEVYNVGDKCSYNSNYYICNSDNVTGEWDSSKWDSHTITNYKPNGTTYDKDVPSTTVETNVVAKGDVYIYDGTTWILQKNTQVVLGFSSLAGSPFDNSELASALNNKVDKVTGKGLSTNDYTTIEKNKLAGIETGAEVNDVTDVQINGTSILNSGIANIPIGSHNSLGVFGYYNDRGIIKNDAGYLYIDKASNSDIDNKSNQFKPIVPANLDYSVRSVLPLTANTVPSTLVPQTEYYLGTATTLTFSLPATGELGQYTLVKFVSGATATVLTVTGAVGDIPNPVLPNKTYELMFNWNGSAWVCNYIAY